MRPNAAKRQKERKMRVVFLLAGCALLLGANAQAAVSFGYGSRPCSEFTTAAQIVAPGKFKIRELSGVEYNSVNGGFVQWALGFASGLRYGDGSKGAKQMTGADFDQALRAYCAKHPSEPFVNAVEDLAKREGIGRK
jgi:hypothetical protein